MTTADIHLATLADLAPRLAEGSLTAEALVSACLDEIKANDRKGMGLSAMIALDPRALDDAWRLDARRAGGAVPGPLHGIPVVVKDNIDVVGMATTSGCRAMAEAFPRADAEQVRRLRNAGAIIVGKTNMSEFSFEIRSRSSIAGDVLNPFNRDVTSGGSSGGAAAAVAAGFAVCGVGTDTGGSIRVPAAYNGLVGLRPTHGLIALQGVAPLAPSTDTLGPIARSAADVGMLMSVMADGFDASAVPPAGVAGVRIGVLRQAFGDDQVIHHAVEAALAAFSDAGAVVIDPVLLAEADIPASGPHIVDWEFGLTFNAYLRDNFEGGRAPLSLDAILASGNYLESYRDTLLKRSAITSLANPVYRAIIAQHQQLRTALSGLVERHGLDAIAYPTSAATPSSLDNPRGGWAPELAACSGWPAVTFPVGLAANGVPIGMELLGPPLQERMLLAYVTAFERIDNRRYTPAR